MYWLKSAKPEKLPQKRINEIETHIVVVKKFKIYRRLITRTLRKRLSDMQARVPNKPNPEEEAASGQVMANPDSSAVCTALAQV